MMIHSTNTQFCLINTLVYNVMRTITKYVFEKHTKKIKNILIMFLNFLWDPIE